MAAGQPTKPKIKKAKSKPRVNGTSGRNRSGQFVNGNSLGVGNKSHTNEPAKILKQALIDAISEQDIKEIAEGLKKKAKNGDVQAAKEIFDRLWGRAKQDIDVEHSGSISFTEALSKATRQDDSD